MPRQLLPQPSAGWRRCLLDAGSLTERLLTGGGRFRVEVLQQRWQYPSISERDQLQLSSRRLVLVREVLLWVDDAPRIYGRTVIPSTSLTGPLRHLRQLNDQSLGTQLFRHPGLRRGPFQLTRIDPSCQLPATVARYCTGAPWLWGRRSEFSLQERRLLVGEIFLPAFRI